MFRFTHSLATKLTACVVGSMALLGKLRSYADYFDAGAYQQDFSWAGTLRGFRVALIVPAGRLPQVQHVVTAEHHDF